MEHINRRTGWIEVICGPMFSGKSEELIRRLRRATLARKKVQVFKSHMDERYGIREVVSHDDGRLAARPIQSARALAEQVQADTDVAAVDEVQFLDDGIVPVATRNQRLIGGEPAPAEGPTIQVGGLESYEARCRACHEVPSEAEDQTSMLS